MWLLQDTSTSRPAHPKNHLKATAATHLLLTQSTVVPPTVASAITAWLETHDSQPEWTSASDSPAVLSLPRPTYTLQTALTPANCQSLPPPPFHSPGRLLSVYCKVSACTDLAPPTAHKQPNREWSGWLSRSYSSYLCRSTAAEESQSSNNLDKCFRKTEKYTSTISCSLAAVCNCWPF